MKNTKHQLSIFIKSLSVIILAVVAVASISYATTGSFTPPTGTTANYRTLGDIYAKLTNFNLNPSATHSVSTTTSPAGSFHTLGEIYTLLTDENQDLIASKIATGTVIFGVRGTLETGTGNPTTLLWSTEQPAATWNNAVSACTGTIDGSAGWRLPTQNELKGAMFSQFVLGLEANGFRNRAYYWSGETFSSTVAWVVSVWPNLNESYDVGASKFNRITTQTVFRCIKP